MRLVLATVLAGLVGLPLSVSAQAAEEPATPEPSAEEPAPSPEPATKEPALKLELDDAGVGIVLPPPRTPGDYTLKQMDRRVRRARAGLGASVVTVLGAPWLIMFGVAGASCFGSPCSPEPYAYPLIAIGAVLAVGGLVGTGIFGAMLGDRKREREQLRRAHYGTPRRVQWDLARSRLVF